MVKRVEFTKRVGLDAIDVDKQEAQKEGYEVEETRTGNVYAIAEGSMQVPESLDELVTLLERIHDVEDGAEEALQLAVTNYSKKYYKEPLYNETRAKLRKEVPKEVQEYIENMKSQAEAGILPVSAEDLENIPYEYKQNKDFVNEYIKEELM